MSDWGHLASASLSDSSAGPRDAEQLHPTVKVGIFRDFALTIASNLVEQVCAEFEREVNVLYNDVSTYRAELARVADILGQQLHREKQLHELLQKMADHHTVIANQAHFAAQQQPNSKVLHDMVDQLCGQQMDIINSGLACVSQAHIVSATHAEQARQLQEPLNTAEVEYNRISLLLQQPALPGAPTSPRSSSPPPGQRFRPRPAQGGQATCRVLPPSSGTRRENVVQPTLHNVPCSPSSPIFSNFSPSPYHMGNTSVGYSAEPVFA
eukprot:TRINITY_DN25695_c0_g1_i1.p1 TRINITY_DN25695_c0_g1~~TRINITY_DN25695_c0_g1_i1.p1  ORF type:complete len:303 (-),score=43.11 TRINITY_DN25695_c0_g1_i1:73-873(-)